MTTIVSMLYNIYELDGNRIEKYFKLGNEFILGLERPLVVFVGNKTIANRILAERERRGLLDFTKVIVVPLNETWFYKYKNEIDRLRNGVYDIYNINNQKDTTEYIILNNNKFAFLEMAIGLNSFKTKKFMWLDFGINHVAKDYHMINEWIDHIDEEKIKQMCINPFVENVVSNKEFFHNIYHHIAGGLFTGTSEKMLQYCDLFKKEYDKIICDEWYQLDEAVMTIIHREHPELFLHYYGDYEGIITNYQKPVHSKWLIQRGLEKAKQHDAHDELEMITKYFC